MNDQTKLITINNIRHIEAALRDLKAEIYADEPNEEKLWGKSAELAVLGKGLCTELNPKASLNLQNHFAHG